MEMCTDCPTRMFITLCCMFNRLNKKLYFKKTNKVKGWLSKVWHIHVIKYHADESNDIKHLKAQKNVNKILRGKSLYLNMKR